MNVDMRRNLARQPFERKIRQVGQLLQLSRSLKGHRGANGRNELIITAIRRKLVLKFRYNGKLRTVEPQTYGLSATGREVLRAYERPATNGAKRSGMAKLFDLKKISGLRESGQTFQEALPAHNPDDSAMVEVFATLPKPKA
jgi:hypothetical protein